MTDLVTKKLELARLRRELADKLRYAFDGFDPDSRPTPQQLELFKDNENLIHWIIAGNRCLAKGTQVATPRGPVAIEDIRVGDTVYDEYGKEIPVLRTFSNGLREVADMTSRSRAIVRCTSSHVWLTTAGELQADSIPRDARVCRVNVSAPLGEVAVPDTYALGALLGDGCSRQKRLTISSADSRIPNKVAELTGAVVKRNHPSNYNWELLGGKEPTYYEAWCKGRYAHEKIVNFNELRAWSRQSLVRFVAGIFDTEGSLCLKTNKICWSVGMQAKQVIDAVEYALLALWNIQANRKLDDRPKYKNGPVHTLTVVNPHDLRRMMPELSEHLVVEHKRWKSEYSSVGGERSSPDNQKLTWGKNRAFEETYDIHVGSQTNLYLLANGLVTHNSGKSASGGRIVSWWFEENHPYASRPAEWGSGPLQLLVVGRLGEQMESELWEKKIRPFLKNGTYKVVRIGNVIQRVEHLRNKNRIIFLSHHDAQNAREKVQAFTANVVWLDEMPDHAGLVTELVMRVLASKGRLYGTFTPLIRNEEIRKIIDSPAPLTRKHKWSMLDNPIFANRKEEILAQVRAGCANEDEFRARMYGDWYAGDSRVFAYDLVRNRRDLPSYYSPQGWRHVAVADPSASGKTGLVVGAEDPTNGRWYVVKAKYLQGKSAFELVDDVEAEVAPYRLVLKLCDCNPAGFYKEAARRNLSWVPYTEKADRKLETIDKTNVALLESRLLVTAAAVTLEEELVTCAWSDRAADKIINASRYHTVDCLRYLMDRAPAFDPRSTVPLTQSQEIRQAWKERQITLVQRKTNRWKRTSSWRSVRLQP